MTTLTRIITTDEDLHKLQRLLDAREKPFTVAIKAGKQRTGNQNRTLHMWFGEIAKQSPDMDAFDIKGICHREWGVTIKLRDPQWAWIWERTGANLSYEKQCSLLASGVLNVSSSMKPAELSEYMEAMQRVYRSRGFTLTEPKDKAA